MITLDRYYGKKQTVGHLVITKDSKIVFDCLTLELKWLNNQKRISCIPEGTYKIVKHNSPKFGACLWIQDVPNRSEILVHHANYVGSVNPKTGLTELLGCVAPGRTLVDIDRDGIVDISESKITMNKILSFLPDVTTITIR